MLGGQRQVPAALAPRKTRYPLYRRLGGPQDRSARVRKIVPPTRIRSPDHPARSESLYRLSYPGPHKYNNKKIKNIFTQSNTTLFLLHQWLSLAVVTTIIRPVLYKPKEGWLHVVHQMSSCMGSHLHQYQYLVSA